MMSCASCNTENPDGAKFCMSCGSALALACPSCGTALPSAEARFCPSCGHKLGEDGDLRPDGGGTKAQAERLAQFIPPELLANLDTARAGGGMQGERRIVTMLFCDVTGSTAAAHSLDPEDWAEIMNGAFEHLIAPVYRYEGTLARLMGDAILAFFGAPIAHEDDPERAVLAGLDILASIGPYRAQVKERWGFDFDVRVGINTGLVVVGEVGSDLRLEYSALGDAVNMASRMESTATPGTIQITEATHKLIAPLFDFDDRGGVEVRGHGQPAPRFRVAGPAAAAGASGGSGGLTGDARLECDLGLDGGRTVTDSGEIGQRDRHQIRRLRVSGDPTPGLLELSSAQLLEKSEPYIDRARPDEFILGPAGDLSRRIERIRREIVGKQHERVAMSAACMVMMLAGAVTAIRLGQAPPLVVYLWSFFPSRRTVLTISAGPPMVENSGAIGFVMLWGGVVVFAGYTLGAFVLLRSR